MLIGTSTCAITTPRTILLNGYSVTLQIGDATSAAVNAAGKFVNQELTAVTPSSITTGAVTPPPAQIPL